MNHHKSTYRRTPPTSKKAGSAASKKRRKTTKKDPVLRFFMLSLSIFFILCALNLIGQAVVEEPKGHTDITFKIGDPHSFFKAMGPVAKEASEKYGLYPSVALAQAALESEYGKSRLSFDYNNYFGIKAHDGMRSVHLKTNEYVKGNKVTISDSFCVYQNPYESFADYARLIGTNDIYQSVRKAKSPAEAARAIQNSGYATDPYYANKIISLINQYNLSKYDPLHQEDTAESKSGDGTK